MTEITDNDFTNTFAFNSLFVAVVTSMEYKIDTPFN